MDEFDACTICDVHFNDECVPCKCLKCDVRNVRSKCVFFRFSNFKYIFLVTGGKQITEGRKDQEAGFYFPIIIWPE